MKKIFTLFILFVLLGINVKVFAQRVLTESEMAIIEEAHAELEEAISNPQMPQVERLRIVERSAKTLKEYGQPPAFPDGDIPLKKYFQENYNQCQQEFKDANDLDNLFSSKLLDQQLKIINSLQIEVVEEQIKIMIPGLPAPYELSKDLVSTFLKWDIVEGLNTGVYGDAQSLVKRFNQMAKSKELIKALQDLKNGHRVSMQNLYRDLKMVDPLEAQLRKKYEVAETSTITMTGFKEGTVSKKAETKPQAIVSNSIDEALVGKWLNADQNHKFSGWQFNADGSAVQYVRDKKYPGWTWEVRGGMLYIIGGNGKSEDYKYKFEGDDLFMEVTFLGKQVWSAPMKKQ